MIKKLRGLFHQLKIIIKYEYCCSFGGDRGWLGICHRQFILIVFGTLLKKVFSRVFFLILRMGYFPIITGIEKNLI
jgi:hypothetical protein